MLPWAPWSCCNSSVLLVCDSIWDLVPHAAASVRRRRRSVPPAPGRPLPAAGGTYRHTENSSHRQLSGVLPSSTAHSTLYGRHHFLLANVSFTRRKRSPRSDKKPTEKTPHAPKPKAKTTNKPVKALSKTLSEGFPQFSLHGIEGGGAGPIGAADTDSPFEELLEALLPRLETEASVSQLDSWFRPSKISRQALQERIFYRVGCGEALSRTVFWVIGMAMTTLLTIWIFQVGLSSSA